MARSSAAKKAPAKSSDPVVPTHHNIPGRIKWFNKDIGYGFVVCDNVSRDIFLHRVILRKVGLTNIAPNRPVHVTFGQGPKGLTTTDLRV